MHKFFPLCVLCFSVVTSFSQSSLYMPLDIKAAYDNGTRSYDGFPGPNYWQNRAEYKIKSSVFLQSPPSEGWPEGRGAYLKGTETITYYNNSPDTLRELVIRLYQNMNRPGAPHDFEIQDEAITEGVLLDELSVNGIAVDLDDNTQAEELSTNLIVHLDYPVLPNSVAGITASWSFTIPKRPNNRMGAYDTATFFIAYWYPQVSVYDDIHGWDKIGYAGLLEFYNDFNDYDVEISVPPGCFVWSTGVLQNPEQVYSPEILSRYNLALQSDSVVNILTSDDVLNQNAAKNYELRTNNWRISAIDVPDFAFAVSDSWLWDACSIDISSFPPLKGDRGMTSPPERGGLNNLLEQGVITPCQSGGFPLNKGGTDRALSNQVRSSLQSLPARSAVPDGRQAGGRLCGKNSSSDRVLISAVYNRNSADFTEVAAISRQTIEYYSKVFPAVPYPYPRMTVFNGPAGMEFPMMVNQDKSNERKWTVYVTTHEIAHTYFPFYMGINERKYAWMDEGWAQNLGEKAQKLIAPDLDQQARNVFRFLNYSGSEEDVPMMVTTDNIHNYSSYGNASYFRPCNAYNFLRDALGDELFLKALHEYIARWHGKHPIPYDFFFTFENTINPPSKGDRGMISPFRSEAEIPPLREKVEDPPSVWRGDRGMTDLGWFFKPWFFEQGYPDLAVAYAEAKGGNIKIIVEKLGSLPVPVYLTLKSSDGDSLTLSESCSIWKDGRTETVVEIKTNKAIKSVYLGNPYIPDALPENNTYIIK